MEVTLSETEDEDPAEYFDIREDGGELLDPLVDNAETEGDDGQAEGTRATRRIWSV